MATKYRIAADAGGATADKAKKRGIPVVSVTSHPPTAADEAKLKGLYLTWVGADENWIGARLGESLLETTEPRQVAYLIRARGDTIILITHSEVRAKLVANRFTFLSLGNVIGAGTKADLSGEEVRHLMAGGAEISDLEEELSAIGA